MVLRPEQLCFEDGHKRMHAVIMRGSMPMYSCLYAAVFWAGLAMILWASVLLPASMALITRRLIQKNEHMHGRSMHKFGKYLAQWKDAYVQWPGIGYAYIVRALMAVLPLLDHMGGWPRLLILLPVLCLYWLYILLVRPFRNTRASNIANTETGTRVLAVAFRYVHPSIPSSYAQTTLCGLVLALAAVLYLRWQAMWIRMQVVLAPKIKSWEITDRLQIASAASTPLGTAARVLLSFASACQAVSAWHTRMCARVDMARTRCINWLRHELRKLGCIEDQLKPASFQNTIEKIRRRSTVADERRSSQLGIDAETYSVLDAILSEVALHTGNITLHEALRRMEFYGSGELATHDDLKHRLNTIGIELTDQQILTLIGALGDESSQTVRWSTIGNALERLTAQATGGNSQLLWSRSGEANQQLPFGNAKVHPHPLIPAAPSADELCIPGPIAVCSSTASSSPHTREERTVFQWIRQNPEKRTPPDALAMTDKSSRSIPIGASECQSQMSIPDGCDGEYGSDEEYDPKEFEISNPGGTKLRALPRSVEMAEDVSSKACTSAWAEKPASRCSAAFIERKPSRKQAGKCIDDCELEKCIDDCVLECICVVDVGGHSATPGTPIPFQRQDASMLLAAISVDTSGAQACPITHSEEQKAPRQSPAGHWLLDAVTRNLAKARKHVRDLAWRIVPKGLRRAFLPMRIAEARPVRVSARSDVAAAWTDGSSVRSDAVGIS